MDWDRLLCRDRLDDNGDWKAQADTSVRKQFHRDYDRVVFSDAFRRLSSKTQVHPLATNDQVRDRLVHSLEVSCVARTFGMRIGEWLSEVDELPAGVHPDDLGTVVQAAALAHDIGNPPFGHAGEDSIREFWRSESGQRYLTPLAPNLQAELRSFEGNAQGFRILSQLDPNPFAGGMRLTAATLASFVKYPWTRDASPRGKYGVNYSEWDFFSDVADRVGLVSHARNRCARHPLVYLLEAADDACYSVIDIEDAIEMRVIEFDQARELLLSVLNPEQARELRACDPHQFLYRARGMIIDQLEASMAAGFTQQYDAIMRGEHVGELLQVGDPSGIVATLKAFASEHIYQSDQKQLHQLEAHGRIQGVLEALIGAIYERYLAGRQRHGFSQQAAHVLTDLRRSLPSEELPLYAQYQRALDHVSGMTDPYLLQFHDRLQHRLKPLPDPV